MGIAAISSWMHATRAAHWTSASPMLGSASLVRLRYLLAECEITLGSGTVEACTPPEGWAHAFLDAALPVQGDIYVDR